MIIRKLFKAESAHIVRNCISNRCSKSIHGHSSEIEVFIHADKLDNAGMIMDFGILKNEVKDFIDSFDHSYLLWNKESEEFKKFIIDNNERYIILPVSPSAESLALLMFRVIDNIIWKTKIDNGGSLSINVSSVRYHETDTGYAETFRDDFELINYRIEDIIFSEGIKREWKNKEWFNTILKPGIADVFYYNKPEQQVII